MDPEEDVRFESPADAVFGVAEKRQLTHRHEAVLPSCQPKESGVFHRLMQAQRASSTPGIFSVASSRPAR